jgi:hypothetical protein
MEPKLKSRCTFGNLKLDRQGVLSKGLVLGGELASDLDRDRIIALLGDGIYTQGCVFVRELLQNAMDATRVQRLVRDRDHSAAQSHLPREAPWLWPVEVTGRDDYAIEVTTRTTRDGGVDYIVFSIRDRGIGMSPRQIKEYFLHVGKSYYTPPQFRKEYSHPSISQFGIGFLSYVHRRSYVRVHTSGHPTNRWRPQGTGSCRSLLLVEHAVLSRRPRAASNCPISICASLPDSDGDWTYPHFKTRVPTQES